MYSFLNTPITRYRAHISLQYPDFTWERQTQGVILGSFFYGYIFTQIPGGWLATKFGGKRIFLIGIGATSVLTILTPILTRVGTGFLISTRILEGLFEVSFICILSYSINNLPHELWLHEQVLRPNLGLLLEAAFLL